jgi:hypothetical protein
VEWNRHDQDLWSIREDCLSKSLEKNSGPDLTQSSGTLHRINLPPEPMSFNWQHSARQERLPVLHRAESCIIK